MVTLLTHHRILFRGFRSLILFVSLLAVDITPFWPNLYMTYSLEWTTANVKNFKLFVMAFWKIDYGYQPQSFYNQCSFMFSPIVHEQKVSLRMMRWWTKQPINKTVKRCYYWLLFKDHWKHMLLCTPAAKRTRHLIA